MSKTHRYDVIPSLPDHRDVIFAAAPHVVVPPQFELPNLPPPKDQGQEGSCTGFSLSTARALVDMNKGAKTGSVFSPAFIYYQERVIEKTTSTDAGAMIRDGLKVLSHQGVCLESEMPYRSGDFGTAPTKDMIAAAKAFKISQYAKVMGLHSIKLSLVHLQPIVLGIAVYESFERIGSNGAMPMPARTEAPLGGHAICCVGYQDDAGWAGGGWLKIENSWGKDWGDGGFLFMPYAYAIDPNYTFDHYTLL
jgi:C1A family cysteine protease